MSWQYEVNTDSAEQYQAELEAILSTQLTPDNIHTYADTAIDQLISLVERATYDYSQAQGAEACETRQQLEDAAFKHFGLRGIGATLNHVGNVADEIHHLDAVIDGAETADFVVMPPSPDGAPKFTPGAGTFREQRSEPRLKTTLFVLEHDFEVDLRDPTDLRMRAGIVPSKMLRTESYYQVVAPRLERMILVCDQLGNATYVLDTRVLAGLGVTDDQVARMTKEELGSLLESNRQLGQRVVYHAESFVRRLRGAILEPIAQAAEEVDNSQLHADASYLYPPAPDETLSVKRFALQLGLDPHTVSGLIERLVDDGTIVQPAQYRLTPNLENRRGTRVAVGLTLEQRAAVRQFAEEQGMLTKMPDDTVSVSVLAERLSRMPGTIDRMLAELVLRGVVEPAPVFGPRSVRGLTPAHQEAISTLSEAQSVADAPEDVVSMVGLAKQIGIPYSTVQSLMAKLLDRGEVDEPSRYYFRAKDDRTGAPGIGLTPAHQRAVQQLAEREGLFAPPAPDDVLSPLGFARALGCANSMIMNLYTSMIAEGALPVATKYRFGSQTTIGLSTSMQRTMAVQIRDHGRNRSSREDAARFIEELDARQARQS